MNLNPSCNSKPELRREIRRRKAACSPEQLQQLSAEVTRRLLSTPRWQQSRTLLLYHSLPDEVSTSALIQSAVEQGKRVLLPVVVGDDLELREYCGQGCLAEGAFHIQEPQGEAFEDYPAIDLAVIPGVAFSPEGARLGRGRGYYDRLLPRLSAAHKCGICWPFQLLPELPTEPHDVRMDEVIY